MITVIDIALLLPPCHIRTSHYVHRTGYKTLMFGVIRASGIELPQQIVYLVLYNSWFFLVDSLLVCHPCNTKSVLRSSPRFPFRPSHQHHRDLTGLQGDKASTGSPFTISAYLYASA